MDPVFINFVLEAEEEERRELLRLERKHLRDHSNIFELPEYEFRKCFRLSKDLARNFIEELTPHMNMGQRNTKVSITSSIVGALRFFAQGSYQRSIGNEVKVAMAQQTFSRVLSEVCNAFEQIADRWVQFPITPEEKEVKKRGFMENFEFPGVIGCVDGTHVAILEPKEDDHLYFNRKGYHSKNVQIICDSNLVILNVKANYGGATHDSFIWRNSAVRQHLGDIQREDGNSWLLGDSAYPQEPWLMTPIRNAARDSPEGRYTAALRRARNSVERCIGVLKMRFRCICNERVLRYEPYKVGQIVNAVCVLHNMCIQGNIPLEEDDHNDHIEEQLVPDDDNNIVADNILALGQQRRAQLIGLYFE